MIGDVPGIGDSSNAITDGLFLGPVIQARDVGSVTLRLPVQVPAALSGLPPASAAGTPTWSASWAA